MISKNNNSFLAWHFVASRNGIPIFYHGAPVKIGVRLEHKGELILCRQGYHASREPLEALNFAPGPYICRVRVSSECVESNPQGQLVSRWREVVWIKDASRVLIDFAQFCADQSAMLREIKGSAQSNANAAIYHASRAAEDPVSAAVITALCARVAFGACCQDPWPERSRVWIEQNNWLKQKFSDLGRKQ